MIGLLVSLVGVFVAGLAGVLGVWMERDKESHPAWPAFFSLIIFTAMGIELGHTVYQNVTDGQTDEQMAVLLERLDDLSAHNPELEQFVAAELAVQERANPAVVSRMEANAKAAGKDPAAVRQKAAEGRRTAAGLGKAPGEKPRPRKERPQAANAKGGKAKAPAPAALPEPTPAEIAATEALPEDAQKAIADAKKQAAAILGNANKQAEEVAAQADKAKAEAEKIKAQADAALKAANKVKADAEKALKAAQNPAGAVQDLTGGGKGKGKGKGKDIKVPGF